ncbi:MAG TPA: IDEAL domain-containing protein [Pseudogracilibacillus sp.]|nr:IDEAL domain-containing protein [Pseudogracilibacillus sp.]
MVTVKMLKPYYIKMNSEYIKIILAYQYFTLLIDQKLYHFVPIEGREILINRKTKKVVNTETKFAFQKDDDIIYITMKKLTSLVDFMDQLGEIIKPYYENPMATFEEDIELSESTNKLIRKLELDNVKRLIDESLDKRDEETFKELIKLL